MSQNIKQTSLSVPVKVYEELKDIARENDLPLNRVLNAIIIGYLRSRRERERND